ncbi:dual oxidase-like isoform X1 [Lingula anatina]|uniref:Dual oxidase-like isoform X1 n=2 Tax=Lingula anatina TaxID=7574 RepID=A0A1S3HSK7_LINAN|nr:dual oxidase-like isoform X1 [Lingula anatina]|eukprot:XP_013389008.1 dual oxidase-like isoform X1 [Lingula anatina]
MMVHVTAILIKRWQKVRLFSKHSKMKNKMPVAMEMQITFICLLVGTLNIVTATHAAFGTERQRYDGWFNNLANQRWGTRGCHLLNTVPQSYDDYTYQPSGQGRPAARDISNAVFNGSSGLPSYNNLTALMAFFGQLVTYEITYSSMPTCPVELVKVPIPKCDQDFDPKCSGREMMPFYRAAYDKRTGRSPNNPRKQINEVTSWIDGSFLYGTQEVWANCLRAMHDGRLKSVNGSREEEFPAMNHIRLPLDNFPSPHKHKLSDPETKWMFGHPRTHMHPGLTALGIVWFRWHNYMADRFTSMMNTTWADEVMFHKTRRWVIATMQNIIMYEWLPTLLNEKIPEYTDDKG